MSYAVELDDDVFEALQHLAEPLVDDINSVLRRLIGLAGRDDLAERGEAEGGGGKGTAPTRAKPRATAAGRPRKKRRARKGSLLPEEAYREPLLEALVDLGGRAPASEVIELVGEKLDGKLGDVDRELLNSGLVRWKSRTQFVRLQLVQSGDMRSDSPRGTWEISEEGRKRLGAGENGG